MCTMYCIANFPQGLVDRGVFYSEYDSYGSHGLQFDCELVDKVQKCISHLCELICSRAVLTLKVLVTTTDAQWEGMGDVGSARYEPALLPPCSTIRILSYSK